MFSIILQSADFCITLNRKTRRRSTNAAGKCTRGFTLIRYLCIPGEEPGFFMPDIFSIYSWSSLKTAVSEVPSNYFPDFFFFDTTSKITAKRRTRPFTARCQFESTPRIDIPLLRTPMKMAPTTAPPTVPVPP